MAVVILALRCAPSLHPRGSSRECVAPEPEGPFVIAPPPTPRMELRLDVREGGVILVRPRLELLDLLLALLDGLSSFNRKKAF